MTLNGVDMLSHGGVGVMPTDTIDGIVGSALNKKTVERIYHLRKRDLKKPMIILIASISDLKLFGMKIDRKTRKILKNAWPGKVSVILNLGGTQNTTINKFKYLHCGAKTLAFRLPRPLWLRELLRTTGPLVASSANIAGKPSARTIAEAKKYFADNVDFYADAGRLDSKPSTLIKIRKRGVIVVRA